MGDRMLVGRYWCYICSQMVNPTIEPEIKCPFCESGFVEEITSVTPYSNNNNGGNDSAGSTNNLLLWGPILLGLIGGLGSSQLRITGRAQINDGNDAMDDELGREFESLVTRGRRRTLGPGIRILQDIRTESEDAESEGSDRGGRMILFDPFNDEALIVQGSFGFNHGQSSNPRATISFSDYLMGPGWDLLLQYLADNDPNRHGNPPAKKEAVKAMPNVTVDDNLQCCVCLENIEIGSQAKEMPCKHKFHGGCITPWLDLHSSCPICRFRLPSDEEKLDENGTSQSSGRVGNRRRYWIPIPWPSEGLLTLSGSSQNAASSSASLEAMPGSSSAAQTEDN
ncbi:hypothetical protein E1A91_D13G197700v1 [Gossypium mustelinum]|uniref:RING-type E3 ubiquitin transferase n=1 Tax=Gossypium mustelinum TaxID=34275 RepID=A0A5D2S5P6_GOSMU|nr:hypothetical protein E1A91_D13G197700v1 [Gossypium mustelinum]